MLTTPIPSINWGGSLDVALISFISSFWCIESGSKSCNTTPGKARNNSATGKSNVPSRFTKASVSSQAAPIESLFIRFPVVVPVGQNAMDLDLSPCPSQGRRMTTNDNIERSEEHTSELQSLMRISYAVFCL